MRSSNQKPTIRCVIYDVTASSSILSMPTAGSTTTCARPWQITGDPRGDEVSPEPHGL